MDVFLSSVTSRLYDKDACRVKWACQNKTGNSALIAGGDHFVGYWTLRVL